MSAWTLPLPASTTRAAPGIEPGTSCTLSENHATTPSSLQAWISSWRHIAAWLTAPRIAPGAARTRSGSQATRPNDHYMRNPANNSQQRARRQTWQLAPCNHADHLCATAVSRHPVLLSDSYPAQRPTYPYTYLFASCLESHNRLFFQYGRCTVLVGTRQKHMAACVGTLSAG